MKTILSLLIALMIPSVSLYGSSNPAELFELSLEELMSRQVSIGTLLEMRNSDKPASVTTITSDDIKLTPHRNLYDLLETYIPGLLFLNHFDSPTIGIRGLISDRNNKVLILINGKVSNQKARSGAVDELEHWDLSDINMIEVIRGPGSVTYGPGGIACVINITTKDYESNDANSFSVNYVAPYNSRGINSKSSIRLSDDIVMFGFIGIQRTTGYKPKHAYSIMNNLWSAEFHNTYQNYQDYYADHFDKPQLKIHLQFDVFNQYKLWLRYGNTGATANGATLKSQYQIGLDTNGHQVLAPDKNAVSVGQSHFTIMLENERNISDKFNLSSSLSYDVQNNSRTMGWYWMWNDFDAPSQNIYDELMDHKHVRNLYNNFSESEMNAQFIFRGNINEKVRLAAGTSLSYNHWGSPLFEPSNNIRMGDFSNIISGTDSPIYGQSLYFGVDSNDAIFVGDGWSTFAYSLFAESEFKPHNDITLLGSFRLDKDSFSDFLFSPRLAIIYELNRNHFLKFIAQQSNRMNTSEELFLENRDGNISKPEILKTLEFIYYGILGSKLTLESSIYYNCTDLLSWYDPNRTTRRTGNLSIIGIELDAKYKHNRFGFGLNHSYTKMLNWELSEGVQTSGISYAHYKYSYENNSVTGYGNNLNNWANNQTKLFLNYDIIPNTLKIHYNTKIIWGFEGAKDGIKLIENIIAGTDIESEIMEAINVMRKEKFYDMGVRINFGLVWTMSYSFNLSLMLQNIGKLTPNWRHKYEAGNKTDEYFFKMNVIEEPFTIGLKASYLIN